MAYSFDLLFLNPTKGSGLQRGPIAKIYINHHTKGDYKGINPDLIYITPECVASGEFDAQIDRLHRELDEVREKAQLAFAKAAASNWDTTHSPYGRGDVR